MVTWSWPSLEPLTHPGTMTTAGLALLYLAGYLFTGTWFYRRKEKSDE